jgi:hypothetical protein
MAAYAETVTLDHRKAINLGGSMAVLSGRCNITNYNTTVAEITDITGHFQNDPVVICSGVSESGYLVHWDRTDKGFKAFYPTIASDQTPTADIVAAAGTEVVNDVDIGEVQFVAFGIV